jgi:hypothetical protein
MRTKHTSEQMMEPPKPKQKHRSRKGIQHYQLGTLKTDGNGNSKGCDDELSLFKAIKAANNKKAQTAWTPMPLTL